MKNQVSDEYALIEHAFQRVMWADQKKFTQLLSAHQLTLPQFLVLAAIRQRGSGCPIGILADKMFQSYPTMTGIVDRLEKAQLVVRERVDPDDRRKVVVNLTLAGSELLERALASRRERLINALAKFSARDRREFLRLLLNYLETFERESE